KHYLAGVLHAGNGRVLYVSGIKKNSSLFIAMLEKLRHHYRRAKTITRNHQCSGMASLLARVKHFMDTVSPFPGNGYGTAKV
ncbi:MAG: IS630 family transposase, partial [Aeromonas sobria]